MHYCLISAVFILFSLNSIKDPVVGKRVGYDSQLSSIARDFRTYILDEDRCEDLARDAEYLADELEDAIDDAEDDQVSAYELNELRRAKRQAEALADFIWVIGSIRSIPLPEEDMWIGKQLVGGDFFELANQSFCTKVIVYTLKDYVTYLAQNESAQNYTVKRTFLVSGHYASGRVNMGLPSRHVRPVWDNREELNQSGLQIKEAACIPF